MGNFGFTFIDGRASAFKRREEAADEDEDGDGEDEDEDDRVVVICPPKVVTVCVVLLPLLLRFQLRLLLLCFAMLHITSITYYVISLPLCAASCAT